MIIYNSCYWSLIIYNIEYFNLHYWLFNICGKYNHLHILVLIIYNLYYWSCNNLDGFLVDGIFERNLHPQKTICYGRILP